MAIIRIPRQAFPGFKALLKLSNSQVSQLVKFLEDLEVGTNPKKIDNFLEKEIGSQDSSAITHTLISFSGLFNSQSDYDDLPGVLTNSYDAQSESDLSADQKERLKATLTEIFQHSRNLKLTLKAIDLVRDDDYIFHDAKITTDIRIVFNDDLDAKDRNAVLIHNLLLEYIKDESGKKISLLLDSTDLVKIRDLITRAIKKEEIIRSDYSNITFLNLSSND